MTEKIVYKWPVDNFHKLAKRDDPKKVLRSPEFALGNLKLFLQFEPTVTCDDYPKDYSGLFLVIGDLDGNLAVNLKYRLWVENRDGKRVEKFGGTQIFDKGWGFAKFVQHCDLYSSSFIKDDFLFICAEVERDPNQNKNLFKWPINEFSKVATLQQSKEFVLPGTKHAFFLRFLPTDSTNSQNHASLFLCAKNFKGDESIRVKYTLWIENNNGKKIEKTVRTATFDSVCNAWGFPNFVHHDKIFAPKFMRNDFLFLCCKIKQVSENPIFISTILNTPTDKIQLTEECIVQVGKHEYKIAKNLIVEHLPALHQLLLTNKQVTDKIRFDKATPDDIDTINKLVTKSKLIRTSSFLPKIDHKKKHFWKTCKLRVASKSKE